MTTPDPRDEQIAELKKQLAERDARIAQLEKLVEQLRVEIERLRRGKRQAAPYSRDKCTAEAKRPGRKAGSGPFANRPPPSPLEVSERVAVERPTGCPCGGSLEALGFEEVSNTDIPPAPKPRVTVYRVPICRCRKCGRTVRGVHPDVAPDQYGATAHRLGDRVMAAAHALHYGTGVPVRKVPAVLQELTGVAITQSAITQDALRRAEREVGDEYQKLRDSIQEDAVVHTDDTGWRVNGKPAQLMTFASEDKTVFQIRGQHRNEEVREVLPSDFKGTMVTDRGRSYDAQELDHVRQQKCVFHVRRSIDEVLETKVGKARWFGEKLKALLLGSLQLWHVFQEGDYLRFWIHAPWFKGEITGHLRPRTLEDPDNQRLLDELGWHHDRGNLLRFLDDPSIPPTNNLAERELRPAVIARKVSQCSKNDRGAYAHAAFASVVRTLKRQGAPSIVDALYNKFHSARAPPPSTR